MVQAPEIARTLKQQGHELGTQVVNSDGKICWLVDGMYMFHEDAADLARRRATKEQIAQRNTGKNIPRY
jgi:hypothetical protein